MIPIKIQCGCGQRYAFDVEPMAGQMPGAVSCPVCGADGTSAGNALIAQYLSRQPQAPTAANARVTVASPAGVAQKIALPETEIKLPPPPTNTRTSVASPPEP